MASGCPPPLWRVSEQSAQTPPAGSPLQDVVLTAQIHTSPETSLERLVPRETAPMFIKLSLVNVIRPSLSLGA